MPIIRSAKKKLRKDIARTQTNDRIRTAYKSAIKQAQEKPTKKTVSTAYSIIDKAAKNSVIHKNKAARLKQQVARHA